ncbi:MAG: cytochrome B [Bacteroidota bacterium]|jgi:hypothetical protein|nr:cytochrome B [Sphingobacteriales bacterium]
MYESLLNLHNALRWGVLLGGMYAITKSVLGIIHKREFTTNENRAHVIFVLFCHTQLLLGLWLYFISPAVNDALAQGMGAVMKDKALRFIAVEHISTMIIAIVLIQVGRSLSKKATDAMAKHRKAVIFYSIGFLLILSRIPWNKAFFPGM